MRPEQTGVATGMNTVMWTVGSSVGSTIVASVIAGTVAGAALPFERRRHPGGASNGRHDHTGAAASSFARAKS